MSNKDENGVSRWWLREPVDHADAESDKGGDFVMHSDYRRVVDALKDELAGTIKVREAAFVQIARLKAENDDLVPRVADLRETVDGLMADLARVRGQRDRLALGYAATPSALESVGLRIVGGTVEEIGS